jgi:hypothetical protein
MRIEVCGKRPPRQRKTPLVFLSPAEIGSPEVSRPTPGAWMHFTAGGEKLLERIVLDLRTIAYFLRSEACHLLRDLCVDTIRICF